jgi:hypothetical protein
MRSIVLAFVLLLFLLPATVSSISISPLDDIVSTVDPGYFESVIFTISNGDNTTTNVSITIDSSLEGVAFFSETLFTVPGNSSRNVSCAISRDSEVTGQIHFTCNSTSIDVDVIVEGESTSTSDDIILIPSTPKAESNLIFIIPEQVDATGYMICYETNNAYVVDIKDGIGCVELGADYGETFVSISTNGHTYTQYFTIDAIFEDELFITIPPDIQVDDTVVFSVSALGLPILAEVTFTMGDETFKKLADESGSVSAVFKKSGNWTINATIFNVEKKEFFNVSPKPLTVSVPATISVGKEIEITISKKATVNIVMGDVSWDYSTDDNGKFFFTPVWPGRYTIHATSTDREGTKQFTATMQTAIIIMDADGIEAEKIQAHKPYSLRVVDIDGKSVNSLIKVYGDNVLLKDIDADGSVLWKPDHQCTYYSFETEPYDLGYDTSSIGLYAVEITGNSIDTMQVIIVIIVVAFVAICVVIYFLKPEIIYALQEKFHKRTRKIRNRRAPI